MSPEKTLGRGSFLVLDGVDGCGKTTQAKRLASWLGERSGREVVHLREPGGTVLGEALRELLLAPDQAIEPAVETLLFAASRRQMLDELVAPALARGAHVVVERFHPSTFAYQAFAGGEDERDVLELLRRWAGDPRPDALFLIEVDPAAAAARRGDASDRIEAKGEAFHRRVADGYRRYAELDPEVHIVDGERDVEAVAAAIAAEVERVAL